MRTACICLLLAEANAQVMTEREAIGTFLAESPQAAELRAAVEGVEAETRGWSLWANPEAAYSREGASVNQLWQVQQRLPVNGRLGLLRQAGIAAVATARSESASRQWQGVSDVRAAFYEVVAAQERERAIRVNLDRLSEITRILAEREKQGEGSAYDRLRAERERAETETELLTSGVATARARASLAALLRPNTEPAGIVASGELGSAGDLPAAPGLFRRALEIRGDYKARAGEIEQYEFFRRAGERLRLPEPSVVAGFNRAQAGPGMASGSYIAISVPLPLFNDGKTEVARFRAEADRARARRLLLEQRIFAELSGLRSALELHRTAAAEYRRGLEGQGQRLEQIARAAYEEGEIGILALLDAWRVSLQARLRQVDLDAASKQAEIELERAAGEPVLNKGVLP